MGAKKKNQYDLFDRTLQKVFMKAIFTYYISTNWSYQKLHSRQLGRYRKGHVAVILRGQAGEHSEAMQPFFTASKMKRPRPSLL